MNEELTIAIEELRKRPRDREWFLPVLLTPCTIPDHPISAGETLRDIQYLALHEDWAKGVDKLVSVVSPRLVEHRSAQDAAVQASAEELEHEPLLSNLWRRAKQLAIPSEPFRHSPSTATNRGATDDFGAHHDYEIRIDRERSGMAGIVVLEGKTDQWSSPEFKTRLVELIEHEGYTHLIVDLLGVSVIDSTTLGVMVNGIKRVRPAGGSLSVVATDEGIVRIFEITGLHKIFPVYPTVEEALASVEKAAAS